MPLPSSLLAEVVIQRPGDETEHGPFPLLQAAEAIARGTFAPTDDARLRGERRWGKLGHILEDHGIPIPAFAPRLALPAAPTLSAPPPAHLHPLLASVLSLGFRDLFLFFLKVSLAWSLASLTILLAGVVLFGLFSLLALGLGVRVFEVLREIFRL